MMTSDPSVRRLQDEAAIRELVAAFAEAANFNDTDGFCRLWAEDAVWTIAKPVDANCQGTEEIVALLEKLRADRDFFVHYALPGPIRINGDEASVRCVCYEAARGPGEVFYRNYAFYLDVLRREGGRWLFSRRDYVYVWVDTSPFEGDVSPLPPNLLG